MSYLQASSRLVSFAALHRLVGGQEFSFEGHEYLKGLYGDESPFLVIRKAAQMGASEYAITRALHYAVHNAGRVIYYFPTEHDVGEFSRDRFAPAVAESDYLQSLVRDTDTAGLKQIGQGSIYFRGTSSPVRLRSVPADFLIFDELDVMTPANLELARKRLGHSLFGWELDISTPSLPGYGIDAAFLATDQRHWLLRCDGCNHWHCLEDEFLEAHGSPTSPRREICFIKGEPGAENLVCLKCGKVLDPAVGQWAAKYPGCPRHGYHLSKFSSLVVSQSDRAQGCLTRPAAILRQWRTTEYPAEFYNSELGLPYQAAEGGLTQQDLLRLAGSWGMTAKGTACTMGVDQGNGLHIVVKEPNPEKDIVFTVRVHEEPMTDATFSHLDHFMEAYDVRACVIDAQPNTHAARAFAERHPGRVSLAYYGSTAKGLLEWGRDSERTPIVTINRTEALDAWRDAYKVGKRRIPRVEGEVREWVHQMTNLLRRVEEDPVSGGKRAVWIRRGPDHYAHADSYAEIALRRQKLGVVTVAILG
jgi:hypothetical protein